MNDSNGIGRGGGQLIHDRLTRLMSAAMIIIGVALLVRAVTGGSVLLAVLGVLFMSAGGGRLYVQLRLRREDRR